METSKLTNAALDWAAAKCEGLTDENGWTALQIFKSVRGSGAYRYSTNWAQGGPIIEREGISITQFGGAWKASSLRQSAILGPTPLIAAMRCYVASKLGDNVEIPQELN